MKGDPLAGQALQRGDQFGRRSIQGNVAAQQDLHAAAIGRTADLELVPVQWGATAASSKPAGLSMPTSILTCNWAQKKT